ncbi:MAG: SDR family oxidoreductase [Arenimonas sp.]|uniref:SDR family NAD(P)-dependent oxidoreductase n=1 Tax=Arenimonas sp. TaxID=1872635 RepID=UPI0025BCA7C1|nr:SDR family NAD(P)-dependent oxidoreductase [Arenimonas sp.]MBW8367572.1 SDR family oxidoreductase [Arenimonas sp.]
MKKAIGAAIFYARFARPFSRLGFRRRVGDAGLDADFSGQRWVVSGATGGIGRAIALGAAARGATVLALGRDPGKLAALAAEAKGPGMIQPVPVDLSLMREVARVADEIAAAGPVDVLVHNVGVMCHEYRQTAEGLELGFATNLLGHWVLDQGLRRGGALTSGSAIISMSSGGMYGAALDPGALQATGAASHDGFTAYAQHKRAQVELTHYWNSLGPGQPRAWVMHPGWVDTDGVRSALPGFRKVFKAVLRTAQDGADTALWLAAARPETGEGIWLDRHRDSEHAFAFTRAGAAAPALVEYLDRMRA